MVRRTGPFGLALVAALGLSSVGSGQGTQLPDPPPLPLLPPGAGAQMGGVPAAGPRFPIKIDPDTPAKDLLPPPPAAKTAGPLLSDDLAKVPEVEFARETAGVHPTEGTKQTVHQLAKVSHLNEKKKDAFLTALLANRPDLAGMPFVMGDDCRTTGQRTILFTQAVNTVRTALGGFAVGNGRAGGMTGFVPAGSGLGQPPGGGGPGGGLVAANGPPQVTQLVIAAAGGNFWATYATMCQSEDAGRTDKSLCEHVTAARVAALVQMLAAESHELRLGLVKYLAGVSHVDATKALARLAIFTSEHDIRAAAADALKVRRDRDYTDVLVKGLRYPLPVVARRTAELIVRTGRADLLPELVGVLDEADPRLPREKAGGKAVVREMVKVNHHRNCMLCHPSGNPAAAPNAITAEVPVQGQPLPSLAQGYGQSQQFDIMVRIDVTYLRQDFSAALPVADAAPWPEMQRFDFFVREREVADAEAREFREKLTATGEGAVSPYHRAALAALRDLTGKDAAPTAEAWRKVLQIKAPTKGD